MSDKNPGADAPREADPPSSVWGMSMDEAVEGARRLAAIGYRMGADDTPVPPPDRAGFCACGWIGPVVRGDRGGISHEHCGHSIRCWTDHHFPRRAIGLVGGHPVCAACAPTTVHFENLSHELRNLGKVLAAETKESRLGTFVRRYYGWIWRGLWG